MDTTNWSSGESLEPALEPADEPADEPLRRRSALAGLWPLTCIDARRPKGESTSKNIDSTRVQPASARVAARPNGSNEVTLS